MKRHYRVLQVDDKYYPQMRYLGLWWYFYETINDHGFKVYKYFQSDAEREIMKYIHSKLKKRGKVVRTVVKEISIDYDKALETTT